MHRTLRLFIVTLLSAAMAAAALQAPRMHAQTDDPEGTECFVSSYYRRVVTVEGFNKIQVTVTLPNVIRDVQRFMQDGTHIYLGSSYLGSGARSEVDAGLAYEVTRNRWGWPGDRSSARQRRTSTRPPSPSTTGTPARR